MAILKVHRAAPVGLPGEAPAPADGPVDLIPGSAAFSILNSLLAAGEAIPHDCGGKARCGTCRIRVLQGGAGLSRPGPGELLRLAAVGGGSDERLACQAFAARDVELEIVGRVRAE